MIVTCDRQNIFMVQATGLTTMAFPKQGGGGNYLLPLLFTFKAVAP
jgi:hypothetical protein